MSTFSLIYPEFDVNKQYLNVLLVDSQVQSYQDIVDNVSESTFPIVYSLNSSSEELLNLFKQLFITIKRIAFVFPSNLGDLQNFMDLKMLFINNESDYYSENNHYSDNVQFVINIIKEFNVLNVDFLACDTLNYSNWVNYYEILQQNTNVIVGASNDKTGNIKYGGNWIMETTTEDVKTIYFNKSIEYYTYLLDVNNLTWQTANYNPVGLTIDDNGDMYVGKNYTVITGYAGGIDKININTPSSKVYNWFANSNVVNGPWGLSSYKGYLYVVNNNTSSVAKISLTNPTDYTLNWLIVSGNPVGITIASGIAYIACNAAKKIVQVSLDDPTIQNMNWATSVQGLDNVNILCNDGVYIYAYSASSCKISKINLLNPQIYYTNIFPEFSLYALSGMIIVDKYLYIACTNNNKISRLNLTDQTDYNLDWLLISGAPSGLAFYNNNLYVALLGSNVIAQIALALPVTCFKEDSKILTNKGYVSIQNLRNGDLVKTLSNGYKAIEMIGFNKIYHYVSQKRIKDQLYKCSKNEYPELFEDLVLTGCHSILIDEFISEKERENTIEVNGAAYVTDNKYRLPACVDERTTVYETPGTYTIYHLALENDDYYMNYGIYANGLLVETCSKRYLKELSDMTFI